MTHPRSRPSRQAVSPNPSTRRVVWFGLIAALVAIAAVLGWRQFARGPAWPALAATSDQNILLVTIDTLRADVLGSYGGRAATPNLDALARGGIRFDFAHAHAVMTSPSHASIMTGRYPFEHGVRDNAGFRLDDRAVTLAELAAAKGFATAAFVGAFPVNREFGLAQGFDIYDDLGGREASQDDFYFSERRAEEVVANALGWIERQGDRRWFAWVHVFDPHAPYEPPPPFDTRYPKDPYAGEVAYVDHALGPLLDRAGRGPRPTTIVVTADHGEGLGDHNELTHGIFAYESTLHVPLILTQVGRGEAPDHGVVSRVPVRHVDILPTLAALAGLDLPEKLPGRSLLEARDGESEPRPSYFEAMTAMLKRGWAPLRGVIVGHEKFIELPIEELYDLSEDPAEARNLAEAAPERLRALSARLQEFGAGLPGEEIAEDAATRARLQSLGYLSAPAARKHRYDENDDPKRLIDIDRLMLSGIAYHRDGRLDDAIAAYRQVIARRPDMNLAYRRLASFHWAAGNSAAAMAALREALATNGPDIEVEVRLGTYLAETGSTREAISILERVAAADPEHTEALNALGIAYAHAGREADAMAQFERVLAVRPRDSYALENLATVYLQTGRLDEAAATFTRAAEQDPRSSRAQAGLGVVALQRGRPDVAINYWRRAVELDGTNYDALFNLATELLNAGRMAEARPYVEQFVRTAPRGIYGREVRRLESVLR